MEELIALERAGITDLTVMVTRGRRVLGRLVVGSVAEQLLRRGTTPVMLVQPEPAAVTAAAGTPAPSSVAVGR